VAKLLPNNKQNGFTFLELLFVLSTISLLLLLAHPFHFSLLEKQQEKQFLDVFESDVLYIQNVALTTGERAEIIFGTNHYIVQVGKAVIEERQFPESLEMDSRNLLTISFNEFGTIRKAGTIILRSQQTTYRIVFPLGKGRSYIVETT